MSEEVKKRVRRSPEEIAAEIDDKIAAHKDAIKKLEQSLLLKSPAWPERKRWNW